MDREVPADWLTKKMHGSTPVIGAGHGESSEPCLAKGLLLGLLMREKQR
jgi:hypothetical protein